MNYNSIVWNTQLIDEILQKLRYGAPVDMSCFYDRDIELKSANLPFQLTHEEEDEFIKCSQNIIYFVEKYCKFLTDVGRVIVNLREYQKTTLKVLNEEEWIQSLNNGEGDYGPKNKDVIWLAARQVGKTTTVAAFFAWYLCFHTDRNLAILANKQTTAFEIVDKVMKVFRGLPFFLKPGILSAHAGGMRLDNGCMLLSQATTKTAQIGFTIHVLYMDEFAHVHPNIVGDFWRSVYPTLSSSRISQCIITSTPNGTENLFYDIWDKSIKEKNTFVHLRTDYWEVPEHDDAWVAKEKANFGEEFFAQEHELKFDTTQNLLLSGNHLAFMRRISKKYNFVELSKTALDERLYRNLTWAQDFDPDKDWDNNDAFVFSVDLGEGRDEDEKKDNDYNVSNIFKIEPKSICKLKRLRKDQYTIQNMFRLRQVGLYRDNIKDEANCALVTKNVLFDQFGPNRCIVHIEMNLHGKNFLTHLSDHKDFYEDIIIHTYHTKPIPGEKPPRKKAGFKIGPSDRDFYCKEGKKYVGEKTVIVTNDISYEEFAAFGKNRKGKYVGIGKHDDIPMTVLNLSRLLEETQYRDFLYDFLDKMSGSPQKQLIQKMLEFEVDSHDIPDDMFNAMWKNGDELTNVNEIFNFNNREHIKYKPGFSIALRKS
jgi:hypothetical protein